MTKLNPNAAFPNPSRTFPTIGFSFLLDSSIPSSYFVQLHQFSALHERNLFPSKWKRFGQPVFINSV